MVKLYSPLWFVCYVDGGAVKRFLKEMAQPVDSKQLHDMLLSEAQLKDKRHAGTAAVVDQGIVIEGKKWKPWWSLPPQSQPPIIHFPSCLNWTDAPRRDVNAAPMEIEKADVVRKDMEELEKAREQEDAMGENGENGTQPQVEQDPSSQPQSKKARKDGVVEEKKSKRWT